MRAKQGGNLNLFVMVGWLVVFNVPSTARSFRNGTPFTVHCEGLFPSGIEPRADAWQSITIPLRHASSTLL